MALHVLPRLCVRIWICTMHVACATLIDTKVRLEFSFYYHLVCPILDDLQQGTSCAALRKHTQIEYAR